MVQVIKFFGTWCGPCKVLAPEFNKAVENMKDNKDVEFKNVDVDIDEDGLAGKHGIMGVPQILFVKDDEVVERFAGFLPAEQIEEIAKQHI
jgi:thioredoxin 1